MSASSKRTETLRVRTSKEEQKMLQSLAARDGVSASDVIRLYIRKAHAEMLSNIHRAHTETLSYTKAEAAKVAR